MTGTTRRVAAPKLPHVKRLSRSFFERDPVVVAPQLLGKLLWRDGLVARIVEVEAYRGSSDAASHAFKGKTARNATMFGPPGHLYVYFTYGMHYCANIVCWPEDEPGAVLLRALAPLSGLDEMAARRCGCRQGSVGRQSGLEDGGAPQHRHRLWRPEELCSGPAKLCQAFDLDRSADGYDLISGHDNVVLLDDGTRPPEEPSAGTRIGLAKNCAARDELWRWWVPGDPSVSGRRLGR